MKPVPQKQLEEIARAVHAGSTEALAPVVVETWMRQDEDFKALKKRGLGITRNEFREWVTHFLSGVQYVYGHTQESMGSIRFVKEIPQRLLKGGLEEKLSSIGYSYDDDAVYQTDQGVRDYMEGKRERHVGTVPHLRNTVNMNQQVVLLGVEEAVHAVECKHPQALQNLPGAKDPFAPMVSDINRGMAIADIYYSFSGAEVTATPIIQAARDYFASNQIGPFKQGISGLRS